MAILPRITGAGYTVELMWEYQFDKYVLRLNPELKFNPTP